MLGGDAHVQKLLGRGRRDGHHVDARQVADLLTGTEARSDLPGVPLARLPQAADGRLGGDGGPLADVGAVAQAVVGDEAVQPAERDVHEPRPSDPGHQVVLAGGEAQGVVDRHPLGRQPPAGQHPGGGEGNLDDEPLRTDGVVPPAVVHRPRHVEGQVGVLLDGDVGVKPLHQPQAVIGVQDERGLDPALALAQVLECREHLGRLQDERIVRARLDLLV